MELSRRDFAKLVGTGGAALGLGAMGPGGPVQAAHTAWGAPMARNLEAAFVQSVAAGSDPLVAQTQPIAENMEPVISHPEQAAEAQAKLAALEKKHGKKPNILIFLMDNVGYGDPGCYGGGLMTGAPTPNMDRLAAEGLKLLSTYSQPSCTPTRCTILTGRLPMRHGQLRPSFAGEPGGLGSEVTVPTILSEAGYTTQAVGKWHCGENEDSQPQNVGFDDFYGFLGWSGLYTDWRDPEFAPEWALSPERTAYAEGWGFNPHVVHAAKGGKVENLENITREVSALLDDKFAVYSEEFIKKMAKSDKPFFLYHCTRGNHFKNYANPKWQGKSPAKYPYKDCLMECDDVLGRLVKALEETGQLENTLVFVTSDNGPLIDPWPDTGWTPFRGGMPSSWEGGVRVPGIVYWKGTIAPGRISDRLFDLSDLFTTSVALGGATKSLPTDRYIDGIDQTSFLLADAGESNRKYIYYWVQDVFCGLRLAEYKLMVAGFAERDPDVVMPGAQATTLETYKTAKLFNLYLDPREQYSFFDRQTFLEALFTGPFRGHMATFVKYPSKKQTGGG